MLGGTYALHILILSLLCTIYFARDSCMALAGMVSELDINQRVGNSNGRIIYNDDLSPVGSIHPIYGSMLSRRISRDVVVGI